MKKLFKVSLITLSVFSFTFAGTEVKEVICGENVENREIVNPSDSFPSSVEKVYCLSKIKTDEAPTNVYHIWYYKGKEVSKVELPIKLNSIGYRVWSSKKILPNWVGEWKLVITDKNGNVLTEKKFNIKGDLQAQKK